MTRGIAPKVAVDSQKLRRKLTPDFRFILKKTSNLINTAFVKI